MPFLPCDHSVNKVVYGKSLVPDCNAFSYQKSKKLKSWKIVTFLIFMFFSQFSKILDAQTANSTDNIKYVNLSFRSDAFITSRTQDTIEKTEFLKFPHKSG